MKNKIVTIASMLVSSSVLAFSNGAPYVGASLGFNQNNFSFKNTAGNKTNFNSSGTTGGLFAGYGADLNDKVYLGGEIFLNTGSVNTSTKITDSAGTTDQLETTYSYGLDLLPGYKITDSTVGYLKAGIVRTRFELTQSGTINNFYPSSNDTITGGQLGFGLQTQLIKNFNVRGEFVHTAYNSYNVSGSKIKPTNNQVNLGLIYKFN